MRRGGVATLHPGYKQPGLRQRKWLFRHKKLAFMDARNPDTPVFRLQYPATHIFFGVPRGGGGATLKARLNTPILRKKNCRFFYNYLPSKTVFFCCRQPYSLPPYNPTTMTIPHTLAKRPSLNEKAVLPHNSHLCLLSSFTVTITVTVTVTVILIFLMKKGGGPKGLGVMVSPSITVAVLSLLAVHCPLSTVHCCFHYYCHYAVPILSPSTVTATPVFLLPSVLHSSATPGCHCHCALCTVHCRCHNPCRYAVPTLPLSTVTVTPLFIVSSPLQSTVHRPLSTVAFTTTVTIQALSRHCPLSMSHQCSSDH